MLLFDVTVFFSTYSTAVYSHCMQHTMQNMCVFTVS